MANTNSAPKRQQPVFMSNNQAAYLVVQNAVEQPFQSLLVIVHARTKVGHHIEGPALPGAVKLKNLLLPLQVRLLRKNPFFLILPF